MGILGAGRWTEKHLAALARLGDRVQVTMIARRHPATPCPAAEAVGARIVTADELLASEEVDAVAVCTPNDVHRAHVERALDAGKHVFCEKPLALSIEDSDAAIAAAEKAGRVLMVGHVTRHVPLYTAVGDVLASGELGAPRAFYSSRYQVGGGNSWRMDPAIGGGAPFDLLIHDFDLMNWYVGRPIEVFARGRRHEQGALDHVGTVFSCAGDVIAVVEGGFLLRPDAWLRAWLRVVCERGHVEADSTDRDFPIRVFVEHREERRLSLPEEDAILSGIVGEYDEFFQAIEGHPPDRLLLPDARTAVHCAELVTRSAETGKPVRFD